MLTLAVNVAVMTLALYCVLGYMTWTETAEFKAGWEAPGIDPRLLIAIGLIFVELMLITAVALFFSTFSTPILSAALTFAPLRGGPLQHRAPQLRSGRQLEAGRLARARALSRPA